jgi:hydroxymethylpyrimidine/phosphomethylpyrimidine kinase
MRPVALTIAGSDSGGGAGIQADIKTFAAHGVFGATVITAVTAQNTVRVAGVHPVPPEFVALQLRAVLEDIPVKAVKTGMLFNTGIVRMVASEIKACRLFTLVVDPVMISKSGAALLHEDAVAIMISELIPLALCVTPNIPEAEKLTGLKIGGIEEMKRAAEKIAAMGAQNVVVKGGHLQNGENVTDVALLGGQFQEFTRKRIATGNTHGTGCTFSAAIAAGLARGLDIENSVKVAEMYIGRTIELSWKLGKGPGPVEHFF